MPEGTRGGRRRGEGEEVREGKRERVGERERRELERKGRKEWEESTESNRNNNSYTYKIV